MSITPADIGIRLRPEDKKLKEELVARAAKLGISLNSYLVLVLKEHIKAKRKLGI